MQSSISSKLLIVAHVALFVVIFPKDKVSSAGLVEKICKQTPYYDLCVTTLQSDPESSKADIQGLARIAAMKLLHKGMETCLQIQGTLKGAKDPQFHKALQACLKAYNTIIDVDINEALEVITKGNPKFAMDGASDIPDQTDKCKRKCFRRSPFLNNNEVVDKISVVVASIAKILL